MQIKTRDFGTIEVTEDRVYHFTQPLFGFEQYSDFIILHDEEIGGSIVWLQSTQEPQLCFIMMDPGTVAKGYAPPLPPEFDLLLGDNLAGRKDYIAENGSLYIEDLDVS